MWLFWGHFAIVLCSGGYLKQFCDFSLVFVKSIWKLETLSGGVGKLNVDLFFSFLRSDINKLHKDSHCFSEFGYVCHLHAVHKVAAFKKEKN